MVGSLPTLKSLISRKGDSTNGYGSRAVQNTGDGTLAGTMKGSHIRLYNMQSLGVRTKVHTGFDSDEVLHVKGLGLGVDTKGNAGQIMRTHEVTISSADASAASNQASVTSFHHAK
jgi:hypothetical protein